MPRQLPQPNPVPDALTQNYLRQLVRELELRIGDLESNKSTVFGVYDYNDLATQTTPISVTGGAGWVKLTNDTLGPQTTREFALNGLDDVWAGGSTNQFDFSGLPLGSVLDIRLDLTVTTASPNTAIAVVLNLGIGDPYTYNIPILSDRVFKSVATYQIAEFNSIYLGNELTQSNPAEIKIKADNSITVKVNGWFIKVQRSATL